MEKRVELLAPCGSYESFLAAVNAGADAVYLGGRRFGARAYAENFSKEELTRAIRQARAAGVKVYLTVNTLVKEGELSGLLEYVRPLCEAGLDGAIVQDMGALCLLRRGFPDLKLHASTQMTITGAYGAAYLKSLGCERIVPARELSLDEIREVKRRVPVEVEAFVHGAMCYCYSGQCLMSSMIGGRSGNRGRCAGPCRLPYRAAGKEGYYLSLKDMNTLEHIPELIGAGIDSFKIEGRMKRPEYVAGVVSIYRKYIDQYYRDPGKRFAVEKRDRETLSMLYIRSGTGTGYYYQKNGRDMLTFRASSYNEPDPELLWKLREKHVRELPETGNAGRPECGEKQVEQIERIKQIEQTGQRRVRQVGQIEQTYSLAVVAQTREQVEKLLPLLEGAAGRGENRIRELLVVDADLLLEEERMQERLSSGGVRWGIKCPAILRESDEKFLEKLRRVIEKRKPEMIYCATVDAFSWVKGISCTGQIAGEASLYAWNAEAVSFWGRELDRVSLPFELSSREIRELCAAAAEIDHNSQREREDQEGGNGKPGRGGRTLLQALEAPVYGRVPFMVSANCVKLSAGRCDKNRKKYAELTDRLGNVFPVYTNCSHCYNVIYNCLPSSCAEDLWMLIEDGIRAFRVEFTTEGGAEAAQVLRDFREVLASGAKRKRGKSAGGKTTRGRFRLGVE